MKSILTATIIALAMSSSFSDSPVLAEPVIEFTVPKTISIPTIPECESVKADFRAGEKPLTSIEEVPDGVPYVLQFQSLRSKKGKDTIENVQSSFGDLKIGFPTDRDYKTISVTLRWQMVERRDNRSVPIDHGFLTGVANQILRLEGRRFKIRNVDYDVLEKEATQLAASKMEAAILQSLGRRLTGVHWRTEAPLKIRGLRVRANIPGGFPVRKFVYKSPAVQASFTLRNSLSFRTKGQIQWKFAWVVRNVGIDGISRIDPFYRNATTDFDLAPGKSVTLKANVRDFTSNTSLTALKKFSTVSLSSIALIAP